MKKSYLKSKTPLKRGTSQLKRSGFSRKWPSVKKRKTGFKRKVGTYIGNGSTQTISVDKGWEIRKIQPLKRTVLKKKSKNKLPVLKRKLWQVFADYVRKRDKGICFICGRMAKGSGYHAGHFIPKSVGGLTLYFHEKNVNGCCYHCNINLGGNLYEYGKKLGEETVAELYALKGQITKWSEEDYLRLIEKYEALTKN